jgi:hypothetical protein
LVNFNPSEVQLPKLSDSIYIDKFDINGKVIPVSNNLELKPNIKEGNTQNINVNDGRDIAIDGQNFKEKVMPSDGNCLFWFVSLFLLHLQFCTLYNRKDHPPFNFHPPP